MCETISPLPDKPSWRGVHLKRRDYFPFTFIKFSIILRHCVLLVKQVYGGGSESTDWGLPRRTG